MTGEFAGAVDPSPSWPNPFAPQQRTLPDACTQACPSPTEMSDALISPLTVTGDKLSAAVPSPSCPALPSPQHLTLPSADRAQVKSRPAAICTALDTPLATTGEALSLVRPLPSCPDPFSPQHLTLPSSTNAQLWALPAATAVTSSVSGMNIGTTTGRGLAVVEPLPSWPLAFAPQQSTLPERTIAQL